MSWQGPRAQGGTGGKRTRATWRSLVGDAASEPVPQMHPDREAPPMSSQVPASSQMPPSPSDSHARRLQILTCVVFGSAVLGWLLLAALVL